MIAANSASSSSYEVSIRPLIDGSTDRTSRHTSMPLPSGRRASSTATSGRSAGMRPRGLLRRPGLADHLDVAVRLEQLGQAPADHLVVVEQEDPDHRGPLPERASARVLR